MITHLLAAAVSATASALITWQLLSGQYHSELSDLRLAYQESALKASQQAAAETARLQEQKDEALRQAAQRQRNLARDVAAARDALGRLQDAASSAADRSEAACPAATFDTVALARVLGKCSAELQDLAARADGHVSDIRTLMEAWPK